MIKFLLLTLVIFSIKTFDTCEECAAEDISPVCGKDGRTYLSECFAKCNKVRVWYEGRCSRHNCPQLYYPVCTASGRTYMNECEANYYQERVLRPGFCRERQEASNVDSNLGPYYLIQLRADRLSQDYRWP